MAEDPSDPSTQSRRREPAFNVPAVIVGCCVVLFGIHAIRTLIAVETDNEIVATLAFVPARITYALNIAPAQLTEAYRTHVAQDPILRAQVDFLMGDGQARWWTFLTYAFLHASWLHVGFNCVWLVAFGSAVARRLSTIAFLLLLVVSAIIGALVQYAADWVSFQIVIGASAAVSGAMGAATRFVFRPDGDPVRIFERANVNDAFRQPALTLKQTFTTKAALVFIVFWFATNLLFGMVPKLGGVSDGQIAWQAHLGGFFAGLLLFSLFDRAQASPRLIDTEETADIGAGLGND